ncbi:hypothetical protein CU098_012217 [Rhizopus stolonifer]|uniref:Uncharacterized protein n=1 Tax=Rhizopus stolonifer TaxID=4846 RepID=A0A367KMH1_RHIST|nr:hypothetical protein CU098_012217 [Rhizopus stolonifer]
MHRSIGFIRTYATKSKTTNLKYKPSVPVQNTTLSDGTLFIERQSVVSPARQATVAPLLRQPKQNQTQLIGHDPNSLRNSVVLNYMLVSSHP